MVSVDLQQLLTNLFINMNIHLTSFSHAPLTILFLILQLLIIFHRNMLQSCVHSTFLGLSLKGWRYLFRNIDIDAFRNDILTLTSYTSSFCDLDLLVVEYEHVSTSLKDKHAPLIIRPIRCRPNALKFNKNL